MWLQTYLRNNFTTQHKVYSANPLVQGFQGKNKNKNKRLKNGEIMLDLLASSPCHLINGRSSKSSWASDATMRAKIQGQNHGAVWTTVAYKAHFQTHGLKLFLYSHKTLGTRYFEGSLANMESEPKRRKIYQPPSRRIIASTSKEERVDKPVPVAQIGSTNFRIQQAKHFAIAQAQQDGCTGNFRIFDSPFGNYFVPVVPTRKDLGA